MADYIERKLAIEACCGGCNPAMCSCDCDEVAAIRAILSADVAPVRHGRWENINDLECFMCSCCGEYANQPWGSDGAIMFSYCPNCGCRMDLMDLEDGK